MNPQQNARQGYWITHYGPERIRDMNDARLLNCYRTAKRYNNPKADELLEELHDRGMRV